MVVFFKTRISQIFSQMTLIYFNTDASRTSTYTLNTNCYTIIIF